MFLRIEQYIDRHLSFIARGFIFIVVIVWIISRFIPALKNWITAYDLWSVMILVLLADVITRLGQIKTHNSSPVEIYDNFDSALPRVTEFIKSDKPRDACLIEYSSMTARQILEQLRDNNCRDIKLLLRHPEGAISKTQTDRIYHQIDILRNETFVGSVLVKGIVGHSMR